MNAEKLKELRKKAGISQKEIASAVGISQVAYSYIERGLRNPSLETAEKIAKRLNTSIDFLCDL